MSYFSNSHSKIRPPPQTLPYQRKHLGTYVRSITFLNRTENANAAFAVIVLSIWVVLFGLRDWIDGVTDICLGVLDPLVACVSLALAMLPAMVLEIIQHGEDRWYDETGFK
jgi:hypothetical protein